MGYSPMMQFIHLEDMADAIVVAVGIERVGAGGAFGAVAQAVVEQDQVGGAVVAVAQAQAADRLVARLPARVVEQAPQLGEIGAGIQLGPNGFSAFDALGVGEKARGRAVYTDYMVMHDALGRAHASDQGGATGVQIATEIDTSVSPVIGSRGATGV